MFMMLMCTLPFESDSQAGLFRLIKRGKFEFDVMVFGGVSSGAKDLIHSLMVKDPVERLSADKVIQQRPVCLISFCPCVEKGSTGSNVFLNIILHCILDG